MKKTLQNKFLGNKKLNARQVGQLLRQHRIRVNKLVNKTKNLSVESKRILRNVLKIENTTYKNYQNIKKYIKLDNKELERKLLTEAKRELYKKFKVNQDAVFTNKELRARFNQKIKNTYNKSNLKYNKKIDILLKNRDEIEGDSGKNFEEIWGDKNSTKQEKREAIRLYFDKNEKVGQSSKDLLKKAKDNIDALDEELFGI